MLRDVALTPTTSYLQVSGLVGADTDNSDIGINLKNVTITNDTDVTLSIKNTGKGVAPSGTGRTLASGESFNYLTVNTSNMWIKVSGSPTGKVILTGYLK